MALLHSSAFAAPPACPSAVRPACPLRKAERADGVGLQVKGFATCGRKLVIFAVSSLQSVRRPTLPRAGLFSKPTTLISERGLCTYEESKIEFRYAKQPSKYFCEFMQTTPKQEVIAFFRAVAMELEDFRGLRDFHLKVRDGEGDFRIEVFFGDNRPGPGVFQYEECIACCPDANLFVFQKPGMTARECILDEFSQLPHAVCKMDVKGRSGFAITPVRHVERMSELDDEELYVMWSAAAKLLIDIGIPFISLIMNHGIYRTSYHLNLKVWVENEAHRQYRETWGEERKEVWERLQKHAVNRPRKRQLCFFHRRDKSCRHGDMCSFTHTDP